MATESKGQRGVKPAKAKASASKTATPGATRAKPAAKADDPKTLLALYRSMLLIRRFEERAGQMYGMGLIGGFCHLYIGPEAVVTGIDRQSTRLNSSH